MKRLTRKAFQLKRYVILSILLGSAGLLVGLGSAYARPHANIDGKHVEAIIEFFVIMPTLCLMITLTYLKIPYRQAAFAISGQLALLWLSNFVGRIIMSRLIQEQLLDDFFGMTLAFSLGSIGAAVLLLGGIRMIWPLRHASTDCPSCGYSLKGLGMSGACPECGQPFTSASLGVSEAELQAEV